MIAAASVERPQVRKVRASQITSGGGDSKASATEIYRQCLTLSVELIGKGGKAV